MLSPLLPVGAVALACLLGSTEAAPSYAPGPAASLTKRFNTFVGCDDKQRSKAGQALADMASLANWAYTEASTDKYGFKHYFRDHELDKFKTAMSTIAQNNDPTNAPFTFILNCTPTGQVLKDCKKSYAITDATVPENDRDLKSMWLCPLFFDKGPDTKNDLPSTDDEDALKKWCDQKDYTLFPTAGHVLLHEITHLDVVARKWLPADEKTGQHSAEDYAKSSRPIYDARRLKSLFDDKPDGRKEPEPGFNAESYAGAATELWAQKFCKKDFIPPKDGHKA